MAEHEGPGPSHSFVSPSVKRNRVILHALTHLAIAWAVAATVRAAEWPHYAIRDYLGKTWKSERVSYPITAETAEKLREGARLLDDAGTEIPWQIHADDRQLSFLASIPARGEKVYRFEPGTKTVFPDLAVTERDGILELRNERTGVRLNTVLDDGAGPIAGWRLASGEWSGTSRFAAAQEVVDYTVKIRERGPVFVTAVAQARFADGGDWSLTVELQAGEPLFKVREKFNCAPSAGRFALILNEAFVPGWILYRAAGRFALPGHIQTTRLGQLVGAPMPAGKAETPFLLEPWVHWQYSLNRGTWFALLDRDSGNTLFMGTGNSPVWVDPDISAEQRAPGQAPLRLSDTGTLSLGFEIKRGQREYFLGTLPVDEVMTDLHGGPPPDKEDSELDDLIANITSTPIGESEKKLRDEMKQAHALLEGLPADRLYRAPLPQQYLIKHSDHPLNRYKNMVLEWNDSGGRRSHPRMLIGPEQLAEFRGRHEVSEQDLIALRRLPVTLFNLDRLIPAFLATGDAELEQRLVEGALNVLQGNIDSFVTLAGDNMSVGVAPHHRRLVAAINLIDSILSSEMLTDAHRSRLRAQLAFLGYLYASPAYWSPERGFGAMFVNMHTTVASIQCAIAGILPDHPECENWMNQGMDYMRRKQLDTWIDEDGRWIGNNVEAPHYALAYDNVLAAMIKAERLGLGDDLFSRSMIQMGEWFAKISTPPDPRILNWRHLPPIGNTYKFEPSGIFGLLAGVYREHDPAFSAEMQWMQLQHGDQLYPGVGGFFGDFAGYRKILMGSDLPTRQPGYRSEWFRGAGAVLRSAYGTEDETMLYMIAGPGARPVRHYDQDQGAITIWGRGVPISDDFGYTGRAPPEDQSLLVSPSARGIMQVETLATGDVFDYLDARQGGWRRRIMLVKRTSGLPEAPEYFVIRDSLAEPDEATWYMWLTAEPVLFGSGGGLLTGRIAEPDQDQVESLLDAAFDAVPENPIVAGGGESMLGKDKPFSVGVGERNVLVNGPSDRQTDIRFAELPPGAAIQTELKSRSPAGVDGDGRYRGKVTHAQIGLILHSPSFSSLLTLVFPRLKTEPAPKVTAIADGRGFQIEHGNGIDFVFLSGKTLSLTVGGERFEGSVGVIRKGLGQPPVLSRETLPPSPNNR